MKNLGSIQEDKDIATKGYVDNKTDSHINNTSNPHSVTKSQIGLGNVPDVDTNDQTPTYTQAESTTGLSSGEKLSIAFGKISTAISALISHLSDSTKHITSSERAYWDGKADSVHDHTVTSVSATLSSSSWTGDSAPYTYTLSVTGVTTISSQEISPAISISSAQLEALQAANIIDGGQSDNTIIFKAYGTKPTIDIPIRITLH